MSRYIFQHTHNSRMPPASRSPTTASSCVATSANRMRSTTAPPTPQKITRARAMPTTTALSPASTISIRITWASAISCCDRSMSHPVAFDQRELLGLAHQGGAEGKQREQAGEVPEDQANPGRRAPGDDRHRGGGGEEA